MARQLWLLRHGDAVPHDSKPDDDRELTPRGERQARDAGAALAALGLEFAACYTSPKTRARDTARLACERLNIEPEEVAALGGDFDHRDAVELFHAHDADALVLAVGHEPSLSQVVLDLTGGRVDLKKGGIAGLRVEGGSGELLVLMRPREVEALAERAS